MGHRDALQGTRLLRLAMGLAGFLPMIALADGWRFGRAYDVGDMLAKVVAADFNGDDIPDVAVLGMDPDKGPGGRISVFLGFGNGALRPPLRISTGGWPGGFAAADLNDDGRLDLAVSSSSPDAVTILLGRGDGTFGVAGRYPVEFPGDLLVEDFDRDGRTDIIVVASPSVFVLKGLGGGRFDAPIPSRCGDYLVRGVAGDFAEHGFPDLVAQAYVSGGRAAVLLCVGEPDGTFFHLHTLRFGDFYSLVPADFDGDGHLDFGVSSNDGIDVSLGRGDGNFAPPVRTPACATPGPYIVTPGALDVGHVDADGRPDLAVKCSDDTVATMRGVGDGTFTPLGRGRVGASGGWLDTADLDRDGDLDVVTSDYGRTISVLLAEPDGTFPSPPRVATGRPYPQDIAAGDLDGDGRPDLAISHSDDVTVLLGEGAASFTAPAIYGSSPLSYDITLGDADGDSIPDLVTTIQAYGGTEVRLGAEILYGRGAGAFPPDPEFVRSAKSTRGPYVVADLSGDGVPDLATASLDGAQVHLGTGGRTFAPEAVSPAGLQPMAMATGDFNADGVPDLAVADYGLVLNDSTRPGSVAILMGLGAGSFAPAVSYETPIHGRTIAVADFDRDGVQDLALGGIGVAAIVRGLGDGSFVVGNPIDSSGYGLAIGDFDGDGAADLARASNANGVSLLYGRGNGAFAAPLLLNGGGFVAASLAADDFDHDGRSDLAVVHFLSGDVSILQSIPLPDTDADGIADAQDSCTDIDGDGHADAGSSRDGCAAADNCPLLANATQSDADRDGLGDACDLCPFVASVDQADRDGDGTGDACDSCPAILNFDQADRDRDAIGDVCDICPAANDPHQTDSNGDGSGDACQPVVSLAVVKLGRGLVNAQVRLRDPQHQPLSGRVILEADRDGPVTMGDALAAADCDAGFLPHDVPGEGIGYSFDQYGAPILFDLEFLLACKGRSGTPDYKLALGPCSAPQSSFGPILDLFGHAPLLEVCVQSAADATRTLDLEVIAFDASGLRGEYHLPVVTLVDAPWSRRPPREIPIPGLKPGWRVRLMVSATDENTVPARAYAYFTSSGETLLRFSESRRGAPKRSRGASS